MTIVEHLNELRNRLILVASCFFCLFLLAFTFINPWILRILKQLLPLSVKLYTIRITEGLEIYIELAATTAFILTLPLILWQLWSYIKPALYPQEQRFGKKYLPLIIALFLAGSLFAYFVLFPLIVNSMLHFSINLGLEPIVTLYDYLSLLIKVVLAFGLLFQLPVLLLFLAKLGLIHATFLRKNRKYVYFGILIIAGLIAPPELISHLSMTIPLILLYEASLLLISHLERKSNHLNR